MGKYKYKYIEYELSYGLSVGYCESLELLHSDFKWHHEEIGSYQGEYYHIGLSKDGKYYLKVNSYGSCSGCDWVEGIGDVTEAEEFFKAQEKLQYLGTDKKEVIEYIYKEIKNCWDFELENFDNIKEWIENTIK